LSFSHPSLAAAALTPRSQAVVDHPPVAGPVRRPDSDARMAAAFPIGPLFRAALEQFRAGQRAALERVYWAYLDDVERTVRGSLRQSLGRVNDDEVADLLQEIFAKAFSDEARLSYDGERPYGGYLAAISRNAVVDWLRRRQREVALTPQDLARVEAGDSDAVDEQRRHWQALTAEYLTLLPEPLRRVHEQRFERGQSQDAAAAALGLTRQRIRTLEHKLLQGLRRFLDAAGDRRQR
jgi:RNA polymerase sigma-70 factor, ECF subfamily